MICLHVTGALASSTLENVTGSTLNDLYGRLLLDGRRHRGGGVSARTVRYLHTILNKALADAVRVGHIQANPGAQADPPSPRAARARVFPVWSPAELARFLESPSAIHTTLRSDSPRPPASGAASCSVCGGATSTTTSASYASYKL